MRFAFALGLATLAAIAVAGGGAGSTILKWRSDTGLRRASTSST